MTGWSESFMEHRAEMARRHATPGHECRGACAFTAAMVMLEPSIWDPELTFGAVLELLEVGQRREVRRLMRLANVTWRP